jgi:hypothetical protein
MFKAVLIVFFYILFIFLGTSSGRYPAWITAVIPTVFATGVVAILVALYQVFRALARSTFLRPILPIAIIVLAVFVTKYRHGLIDAGFFGEPIEPSSDEDGPSMSQQVPSESNLPFYDGVPNHFIDYYADDDAFDKASNDAAEEVATWIWPPKNDANWQHRLVAWRKSFEAKAIGLEKNNYLLSPERYEYFLTHWNKVADVMLKDDLDVFHLFQAVWRSERTWHQAMRNLRQS